METGQKAVKVQVSYFSLFNRSTSCSSQNTLVVLCSTQISWVTKRYIFCLDLREKLYFVDTFCKRINDNIESYNKYKDKVYQDGSTCQLVLPKELKSMTISRSSSGMPIAASPSKFTTKDFIIVTMLYIYVNYMLFVN